MLVLAVGVGIGRPLAYCSSAETSQSLAAYDRYLLEPHFGNVYCTAVTRVCGIWKLEILLELPGLARILFKKTVLLSTPSCSDFCHVYATLNTSPRVRRWVTLA